MTQPTESTPQPAADAAAIPPPGVEAPAADSGAAAPKKPLDSLREIAGKRKAERDAVSKERARAAEYERKLADLQRQFEQTQARAKQFDEWENLSRTDKIAAAKRLGIAPRELAETIVKEGTPEAQQAEVLRRLAAQEEDNAKLRKELEERDTRARQERAYLDARKALQDEFDKVKQRAPFLAKICATPAKLEQEFADAVQRISRDPEASKHRYSDEDILLAIDAAKRAEFEAALEAEDPTLLELLEKTLTRRRGQASSGKQPESASSGQTPKNGANGRSSKTLTNGLASDGASNWRPTNWDKLSDRQQNKILAERLDQGLPID